MLDRPRTRWAMSDGHHIAYQVVGDGPVDLVHVGSVNVEGMWAVPPFVAFLERMARSARIILADPRGLGMSDPVDLDHMPPIETWVDDYRVVLDDVGSSGAIVFGNASSSIGALMLAATHPERVDGLVVLNATARVSAAPDYPIGMPPMSYRGGVDRRNVPELTDEYDDARVRMHWLAFRPKVLDAITPWFLKQDVRSALPLIGARTLVLHRKDYTVPVTHGRYVAEHIPNATFVELEGSRALFVGEPDVSEQLERFVAGEHAPVDTDRFLATVLFTDIVSSTARTAAAGDTRWRETIDRHDAIVRRELERYRGTWVTHTGDGVLAMFDGPGRAIECADSIRTALLSVDLEIRAGLHTGEVTRRHEDIAGLAVVMARRVCDLADDGQILVSRTVHDLVIGSRIALREHGTHELKGVPGEWTLYEVSP